MSEYKTFAEEEYALMLKLKEGYTPKLHTIKDFIKRDFPISLNVLERMGIDITKSSDGALTTALVDREGVGLYNCKYIEVDASLILEGVKKYDREQEASFEETIRKEYQTLLKLRTTLTQP